MDVSGLDRSKTFLVVDAVEELPSSSAAPAFHNAANNLCFYSMPSEWALPSVNVSVLSVEAKPDGNFHVIVEATGPAYYVVLTTAAQGRFFRNALFINFAQLTVRGEPVKVAFTFIAFEAGQEDMLRSTVRVEHLGGYIAQPPPLHP